MAMGESRPPADGIPQTVDEFVELYYERIKNQIKHFVGIDYGEVEDIAQIIVMQFIEGDYINIYSHDKQAKIAAERHSEQMVQFAAGDLIYKPVALKGKFTSFLFEFVKCRLMGIRDRANRMDRREGTSLQDLLEGQSENREDERRIPVSFIGSIGTIDKEFVSIELRQILKHCHKRLVDATTPTFTRNLPELFQVMCTETFTSEEGKFDKQKYADSKGITVSAVSMQQKDLRQFLRGWGLDFDLKCLFVSRSRNPEKRVFE